MLCANCGSDVGNEAKLSSKRRAVVTPVQPAAVRSSELAHKRILGDHRPRPVSGRHGHHVKSIYSLGSNRLKEGT